MTHRRQRLLGFEETLFAVESGGVEGKLRLLDLILRDRVALHEAAVALERLGGAALDELGPLDARELPDVERPVGSRREAERSQFELEGPLHLVDGEAEVGVIDVEERLPGGDDVADVVGHADDTPVDQRRDVDLLEPMERADGADAPLHRPERRRGHRHHHSCGWLLGLRGRKGCGRRGAGKRHEAKMNGRRSGA